MIQKTMVWAFLAAVIALASVGTSMAAVNACTADQEKYCSVSKVGEQGVLKCMDDNFDKLSAECRALIEKVRAGRKASEAGAARKGGGFRTACRADAEKLCKEMIGKPMKVKECLIANESKLSDTCKAALKEAGEKPAAN